MIFGAATQVPSGWSVISRWVLVLLVPWALAVWGLHHRRTRLRHVAEVKAQRAAEWAQTEAARQQWADYVRGAYQTAHWRRLRKWCLAQVELYPGSEFYVCQRCGDPHEAAGIQIHHRHYETLYRERPEDVIPLCQSCHHEADQERREEEARRAA